MKIQRKREVWFGVEVPSPDEILLISPGGMTWGFKGKPYVSDNIADWADKLIADVEARKDSECEAKYAGAKKFLIKESVAKAVKSEREAFRELVTSVRGKLAVSIRLHELEDFIDTRDRMADDESEVNDAS